MTPNPKNLYRVDRASTHAWYVQFKRNGIPYEQMFSDSLYGSNENAKAAAIIWRDTFIKNHPVSYRRNHSTKRSSTHVVNVTETSSAYNAYWYDGTTRKYQSFAKKKYGDNAIKMAMFAARIGKKINPVEWVKTNSKAM